MTYTEHLQFKTIGQKNESYRWVNQVWKNHTYQATKDAKERYNQMWTLKRNTDGHYQGGNNAHPLDFPSSHSRDTQILSGRAVRTAAASNFQTAAAAAANVAVMVE